LRGRRRCSGMTVNGVNSDTTIRHQMRHAINSDATIRIGTCRRRRIGRMNGRAGAGCWRNRYPDPRRSIDLPAWLIGSGPGTLLCEPPPRTKVSEADPLAADGEELAGGSLSPCPQSAGIPDGFYRLLMLGSGATASLGGLMDVVTRVTLGDCDAGISLRKNATGRCYQVLRKCRAPDRSPCSPRQGIQ